MNTAKPDLSALNAHLMQAQAVAATLRRAAGAGSYEPLDAVMVADVAEVLGGLLAQAQGIVDDLADCAVIPVLDGVAWRKVRALEADLAGC